MFCVIPFARGKLGKREFTSFDVAAAVRELKEVIVGSRVNNVYQLNGKTLLLKLHKSDKPAIYLVLEAGRRLHLMSYAVGKPETPPAFCMALRKYLRNAWLTSIGQHEFERTIIFNFRTKAGELRLVPELFGDGNIILVGENGEILQALAYMRMRDRNVLRGETFSFAPSKAQNPLKITWQEFHDGLKSFSSIEVVRAVTRLLSIGGANAEEVLLRTSIDKTKLSNAISEDEAKAIFNCLKDLTLQVTDRPLEPGIILDGVGRFVDVVPFRLRKYEGADFTFHSSNSFNDALDEYYARTTVAENEAVSMEIDQLKRETDRLKRVIAEQEKVLIETEGKAEKDKQVGDVIYAHCNELQLLLDKFLMGKQSGKDWKEVTHEIQTEATASGHGLCFESFDTKGLIANVRVDDLSFGLDTRATVFENASRFFERGKRIKQKLAGVRVALNDSRAKLAEAEVKIRKTESTQSVTPAEQTAKLAKLKLEKKEWFEKFRWFMSSEDFLVVAGKDAVSNEVLIKKYTEPDDVVFHADIVGSPFVVIKTGKKPVDDKVLREAAEFAAAFSRGWREGFGSVDVYWVKPEQLSKSGPSGEYVTHGAFAVSGKREWIRNVPLRIAVGTVVSDVGEIGFVGGPVDAVKERAKAWVIIVPGDQNGKEMFRHILHVLAANMAREQQKNILETSMERIRVFIPFGKGRVLEK